MRQVIKIPSRVYLETINPKFQARLKQGFARCKSEAKSYAECVKKQLLETDQKACQKQFSSLMQCLKL